MGVQHRHQVNDDDNSKNWKIILAAVIPVWGVVMFIGWFVISALVPMMEPDKANQIANDAPDKAIVDFNTAAGESDAKKLKK
ncbi:MAG: hypothetical protein ACO3MW_05905 [Rhodospirillales bacterium]|jgi:hypothetical protein